MREDALQLFGFATPLEQALFERLISVSIDPKLAWRSSAKSSLRHSLVGHRQAARIPGVGKAAERLVVELKDRLPKADTAGRAGRRRGPDSNDVRDDLLSALRNLGYPRNSVEKTVDKVLRSAEDRTFEPLLRATLKLLMGR